MDPRSPELIEQHKQQEQQRVDRLLEVLNDVDHFLYYGDHLRLAERLSDMRSRLIEALK